jgi:parvulin-like peptidyl-prolyl isomerase
VAEGGDFILTIDDLRGEVRNLGPSASYDDTIEGRLAVVHNLAARHFIANEAVRMGLGVDELADVESEARKAALAEAYHEWKIDKRVMTPRIQSRPWIEKLGRKLHLKDMRFAAYAAAEDVLAMIKGGRDFESLAETFADRQDVSVTDMGLVIWKDLNRDLANIVFRLDKGAVTEVIPSADGYHIFYLADDEFFDISIELLSLRSRRFVAAMETEQLVAKEKADLRKRFGVRFLEDGIKDGLEAFRIAFEGGRPPDSLFEGVIAVYEMGEVRVADLYNTYFTMAIQSRPYVGDHHAVVEFATDIIMPDLEALAGEAAGVGRRWKVQWAIKAAREELLVPLMEDHFRSQIEVTEADIAAYYTQHRDNIKTSGTYQARRILVESRPDLREVRRQLSAGRDFADVARDLSQDEYTAPKGGEMGEVTYGLLAVYDSVVALLEPGEVSEPFETEAGIEILKLESKEDPRFLSIDEAREKIELFIANSQANDLLTQWVNTKKEEVGFRVNEDLLARVRLPTPEYKAPGRAITKPVDLSGEVPEEEQDAEVDDESGAVSDDEPGQE